MYEPYLNDLFSLLESKTPIESILEQIDIEKIEDLHYKIVLRTIKKSLEVLKEEIK